MTKPTFFCLPRATDLQTIAGWQRHPDDRNAFYTMRFQFMLRERQIVGSIQLGEVIDSYSSVPGVDQVIEDEVELEHTTIHADESVEQSLYEDESVLQASTALGVQFGPQLMGGLSGELASSIQERVQETLSSTFRVQVTDTQVEKRRHTHTIRIDPTRFDPDSPVVAARQYKRTAYDLYLATVDFVMLEYARPRSGIKFRLYKHPPPEGRWPPNVLKLGLPLATVLFWRELPRPYLVLQRDYRLGVEDPYETEVVALDRKAIPYTARRPSPTLYELSNQAFEHKVWRIPS